MDYVLMKNIISKKYLLFLSSMRSYADSLKKNKFKLDYTKIEDKEFKDDYLKN
jgi:deoxyribodipyrimidine photolyase-related protein